MVRQYIIWATIPKKYLAENGVKLIQIHKEWNDPVRFHGGNKFHAVDPHQYIAPCLDRRYIDATMDIYMAYTVPFMQFPLLKIGRPLMGKNG